MKKKSLKDYQKLVGKVLVKKIIEEAKPLVGKHIIHVSSTPSGGGVAEMLHSLIPLMNGVGLKADWRIIHAPYSFFTVTKKFHNTLQGEKSSLSTEEKSLYEKWNRINSHHIMLNHSGLVVIHDPQPLALIKYFKKTQPWIWRCHIDLSNPNKAVWNYLKQFIKEYDGMIISMKKYSKGLVKEHLITPSIDPLTDKNRKLTESEQKRILNKYRINLDKPIVSQISRFDKWKDPLGVIEAFKKVKKRFDCQLVLLGNMARDDPEGAEMYEEVIEKSKESKDILIRSVRGRHDNDFLVNALQTVSNVVLQKSVREGFALTVSEALWKGTPVIGGNVGGIPLQIINGKNGYLVNSVDDCAKKILRLLKNPKLAEKMGVYGREHVRKNFLVTNHLLKYLKLFNTHIK